MKKEKIGHSMPMTLRTYICFAINKENFDPLWVKNYKDCQIIMCLCINKEMINEVIEIDGLKWKIDLGI